LSAAAAGGAPPPEAVVGDAEGGARGGAEPLARAVFAALVVACFAAFFVTQRLKHTPTVVQNFQLLPSFSPTPVGRHKEEQISFKLRSAEHATVAIIEARGNVVATLLRGYPVARYKQLSLRWNGRRGTARRYSTGTTEHGHRYLVPANTGRLAPPGEYRVRLTLSGQPNPVLSARTFTLVRR
jgi:hypothetical protein